MAAPTAQAAPTGIHVSNGRLGQNDGSDLILRGVNHAHTWYQTQTSALAQIKAKGSNGVRVVLASGRRWAKNDTADVADTVSAPPSGGARRGPGPPV
ncbi:hypothetical protein ACIHCQ_27675 [Streptomyces sp. NPDC052236]|uniref:hypothetical protein n=1 Tax=Streptomyces sp. NPDC052236 TaxID=3365686 RepID=UPI0037CF71DF